MARELMQHADEIDGSYKLLPNGCVAYESASLVSLAELARRIREDRAQRNEVFGDDLFGEPAWDILLYLFETEVKYRPVQKTELTLAAGVPHSTGLRYLRLLEERKLLTIGANDEDARAQIVKLSTNGMALIANCLARRLRRERYSITDLNEVSKVAREKSLSRNNSSKKTKANNY